MVDSPGEDLVMRGESGTSIRFSSRDDGQITVSVTGYIGEARARQRVSVTATVRDNTTPGQPLARLDAWVTRTRNRVEHALADARRFARTPEQAPGHTRAGDT
jgi:hypothetical protein